MKEYLMLIRENLENYGKMTPEEVQKDIEQHVKWVESLVKNGNFKGGNPLMPVGKYVKGKAAVITDGPYIESKEGVSGYYFLLAKTLEDVTIIAKGIEKPAIYSLASIQFASLIYGMLFSPFKDTTPIGVWITITLLIPISILVGGYYASRKFKA